MYPGRKSRVMSCHVIHNAGDLLAVTNGGEKEARGDGEGRGKSK